MGEVLLSRARVLSCHLFFPLFFSLCRSCLQTQRRFFLSPLPSFIARHEAEPSVKAARKFASVVATMVRDGALRVVVPDAVRELEHVPAS